MAVLQGALRVRDWTERHKGGERLQERLLDLLAADLRQVIAPAGGGEPLPLQWEPGNDGSGHLSMVTLSSFALNEPMPAGLYRVTYRYDAKQMLLERREVPLGAAPEEEPGWIRIAGDLAEFSLSFHDAVKWQDRWPAPGSDRTLPVAIRIELRFENGRQPSESSRLIVLPTG